jgi:hypothetical protein
MAKKPIQAIAFFNEKKIKGIVTFTEDLKQNDRIIKCEYPIIDGSDSMR